MLNILQTHSIYKDVFREVGMLEVMVTCLHRYAALLKTPESEEYCINCEIHVYTLYEGATGMLLHING
jgi:hypothetical protein